MDKRKALVIEAIRLSKELLRAKGPGLLDFQPFLANPLVAGEVARRPLEHNPPMPHHVQAA